jgi:hypothetical protein
VKLLAAAALLCAAPAALALPPDARLEVFGRAPVIQKIDSGFAAVEAEPEGVLRAELLPTQELLLEPRAQGLARVFLFAGRIVRVIEVAVDQMLPPASGAPLPPACVAADKTARIADARCYEAWRERLQHAVASEAPALEFGEAGLRAQLAAAQGELDRAGLKGARVAVSSYGLRLLGLPDEAARRRALRAIWAAVLGPLRIDG